MVKLPSMRTSPLKRPAIRTLPLPSILPSMVIFAEMTDSPPSEALFGVGRRAETARDGSLLVLRSGAARSTGAAAGVATGEPAVAGVGDSFQSAINDAPTVKKSKPT